MASSLKTASWVQNIETPNFDRIKLPRSSEKHVEAFSEYEQRKIESTINLAHHPKQIGIVLSLYLGLRLGEVCALKWSDIDFESKTLQVSRTVYLRAVKNEGASLVFSTPKTESSYRTIPVPSFLIEKLERIKKNSISEFVVSDKHGKCVIPRTYQYEFASIQKKAGVERKGFHSLRHTFATRALECGMDVKSLSEIMGHKRPDITLARYVHSMLDRKKAMMDKIGELYTR